MFLDGAYFSGFLLCTVFLTINEMKTKRMICFCGSYCVLFFLL